MSKLTKFLETRTELLINSASGSIYYRIGNKKIRIANHLSANSSQFALNILVPNNSNTQYILAINNKVFIYNTFTELKPFLINWCIIMQSAADISEIGNNTRMQELEKEVIKLRKENETFSIVKSSKNNFDMTMFTSGQQLQIKNFIKAQTENNKKK